MKTHWRLPRGVDEILPPAAWQLELLRRRVLDLFVSWGFEYVEPPIIEYLESLLVGSGEDLDLQTLKVVDQVSGKQLGVRADMTSQAVRIDAHSRATDGVQRLCYAGPVVFANPQLAMTSRVPFKAGAEIFGAPDIAADAEIVSLMLQTIESANIEEPVLLLGHMGIYRGLVDALLQDGVLDPAAERDLFDSVQRKSQSDITALLAPSALTDMLIALPTLMGGANALDAAHTTLAAAPAAVLQALAQLQTLVETVAQQSRGTVRVDVSELSGYGYHNGPVFAVYHPQHGQALAQGGRYDGIGAVFGRSRPATGFDVNLKALLGSVEGADIIFAPYEQGQASIGLAHAIAELRARGERVQCALSAAERPPSGCRRIMTLTDDEWRVQPTDADQ